MRALTDNAITGTLTLQPRANLVMETPNSRLGNSEIRELPNSSRAGGSGMLGNLFL